MAFFVGDEQQFFIYFLQFFIKTLVLDTLMAMRSLKRLCGKCWKSLFSFLFLLMFLCMNFYALLSEKQEKVQNSCGLREFIRILGKGGRNIFFSSKTSLATPLNGCKMGIILQYFDILCSDIK